MSINLKHSDSFIATNRDFQLVHSGTLGLVALTSGAVHFTKKLLKAVICGECNKWKEQITVLQRPVITDSPFQSEDVLQEVYL